MKTTNPHGPVSELMWRAATEASGTASEGSKCVGPAPIGYSLLGRAFREFGIPFSDWRYSIAFGFSIMVGGTGILLIGDYLAVNDDHDARAALCLAALLAEEAGY